MAVLSPIVERTGRKLLRLFLHILLGGTTFEVDVDSVMALERVVPTDRIVGQSKTALYRQMWSS